MNWLLEISNNSFDSSSNSGGSGCSSSSQSRSRRSGDSVLRSCVVNSDDGGPVKPEHYFDTIWNMQLAVSAIDVMAERCAEAGDVCFGVQVLNEP